MVEHGGDGGLEALDASAGGSGFSSGIVRVYAGETVGAAFNTLRARAVATDFLLSTWRASLAESTTG